MPRIAANVLFHTKYNPYFRQSLEWLGGAGAPDPTTSSFLAIIDMQEAPDFLEVGALAP
jgi:hypothetical protein